VVGRSLGLKKKDAVHSTLALVQGDVLRRSWAFRMRGY